MFEVKRDGTATIRAEHQCTKVMVQNALANYAARKGAFEMTVTEAEAAVREILREMGSDAYVVPEDMYDEDDVWVAKQLTKIWKDPR